MDTRDSNFSLQVTLNTLRKGWRGWFSCAKLSLQLKGAVTQTAMQPTQSCQAQELPEERLSEGLGSICCGEQLAVPFLHFQGTSLSGLHLPEYFYLLFKQCCQTI